MARRMGAVAAAIAPLVFAASSLATTVPPFTTAYGPITSLTPSGLTVQANAEIPTSCTTTSSSPTLAGFRVGDQVTIACKEGVLASITMGRGQPGVGRPVIPIAGLAESFSGALPTPGPSPTQEQCAAAWNKNAPPASRAAIAALSPLAVQVGAGSAGVVSPPPNPHTVASGPTCVISFVLPGARTAQVSSVWKQGTAQSWRGFIDGGYRPFFVTKPGFSVSASGTLSGPD
jgi:hypothetical protein